MPGSEVTTACVRYIEAEAAGRRSPCDEMPKRSGSILWLLVVASALLLVLSRWIVELVYPDYVAIAEKTTWTWSDERATADFCAARLGPAYRLESTPDSEGNAKRVATDMRHRRRARVGRKSTFAAKSRRGSTNGQKS